MEFPVLPKLGEVSHRPLQILRTRGSLVLSIWFLSSQLLIPRVSNSRVSDATAGRSQKDWAIPTPSPLGEERLQPTTWSVGC